VTYFYSMIRFVPDTARGEFINLGAVVGDDDQQDWELRLISNFSRAKAIDANGYLPSALTFAGELEQQLPADGVGGLSLDALNDLAVEMNNVVQLSRPTPIAAADATTALDTVFEELVLDPASRRYRFEKKHRAVRLMREAYRHHQIPEDAIKQRVNVRAGHFTGTFDFAVHNGHAVQLVNCWSFQLPNQVELAEQVKAWAWVVHDLREHGGTVFAGDTAVPAEATLDVAAVYIPPKRDEDHAAFDEARAAFNEIAVEAVLADDADSLGQRAAEALGAAASA
jgi:hypothetical protein